MNRFRTLYFVVSFIVLPNLIVADNAKFPDFTQLVKEVAPAVVNVSASRAKKRDSPDLLVEQ